MTSLPRTRPVRRSSKRADRAVSADAGTGATTTAKPKTATPKTATPKTKAPAKSTAASNGSAPRTPRTTPRPKPAASEPRTTPRPRPAAAAGRSDGAAAKARPAEPAADGVQPGERPVPPKRKVPAAGYAAPSSRSEEHDSAVADLVTTTVQAASELAKIGIDVGRAAVRSMLDRLPKA